MKYILVPSHAKIWGRLAQALQARGFTLQSLIGLPSQFNSVEIYQGVSQVNLWDLNHGRHQAGKVNAKQFCDVYEVLLGSGHERKIFEIMGRLEKISALPFYEKSSLLKLYIRYALDMLQAKPDFILFAESPHSPFTLTLMEVARVLNMKVVLGNNNPILPTIFFDIDGEVVSHAVTKKPAWLTELFENWFERQTADYDAAIPLYMTRQQKKFQQQRYRNLGKGLSRGLRALTLKPRKEKPFLTFSPPKVKAKFDVSATHYLKRAFDKADQKLLDAYEKRCDDSWKSKGKPFVYFPMHYQPEMTSNPDGLKQYDQQNLIYKLRSSLPSDYNLVVREHPSQFYLYDWARGFRSENFYKSIAGIEGVILSSVKENPFELTDRCAELVTLTGSAALEACLRNKSASYFGRPWYRGCPNIRDLSESSLVDIDVQIDQLFDKAAVRKFLEKRILHAPIGTVNPSNIKDFIDTPYNPEQDDQIEGIASNLEKALK